MNQQNLQQIKQLLKEEFKENNKILREEIIDEIGVITNQGFSQLEQSIDKRFDAVDNELKKKATSQQMLSWGDNKIVALELDMDKVKYIHLDEWEKLPPTVEISKTLVEHKLKKKR